MKLKSRKDYPLDVRFLADGEEQVITLMVSVLTPRKMREYSRKMEDRDATVSDNIKLNCEVVTGWKNVEDEDGNPLEFDVEKLRQLQEDYFGLCEAIYYTILSEAGELRKKNVCILAEALEEEAENQS